MPNKYWLASLALAFSLLVAATSFVYTTDAVTNSVQGTSDVNSSDFGNDKVALDAKGDAASFVGNAGTIRGAYLETALQHIRDMLPLLLADDMRLAQSMLAI